MNKTQVFSYRAVDTCTVFKGDERTQTLRSANGDGFNISFAHGDMLIVHRLLFKNGRPIRLCLLGNIGLQDGSVIFSVLPHCSGK
jgi:hypothetical protein